ncbi:hypothetical protein [Verrucomicrobium sp. BvORR034]|uniref:hypothetical protein n=1 Tax=Verrucomicrobium sp. BvORR034 TaxID=1396418 RepID=UPI002240EFB8|nr:hypothetical protein [Verrucomicrobium sp. BvORR034]
MTKTTKTLRWACVGAVAAALLLAGLAYWQTREKRLDLTEVSVLKASATDPKVAPDMEELLWRVAGGEDRRAVREESPVPVLLRFQDCGAHPEGPDRDSVLVVEQKGHEEEARVYRASQRLNHPQNAAQFLESLPGGLYRSGTARLEMR